MTTVRTFRLALLGTAFALGAGTVVAAQPPAGQRSQQQGQSERGQGRRGQQGPRGQLGGRALFRGITLTETQRTQVREIHRKYGDQRQALVKDLRAKAGVAEGQRPDSAARAQLRTRVQTESRALMERQVADLRNVLTGDQRATFDKNLASARERFQARGERGRDGRPGRAGFRRGA